MAKTLENYDPLVQIPSGMTPAGADFPIVESHDILVGENDKRLDAKLDDIDSAIGNVGETPIATQLSSKVNTGDIVTSVAATGSTSNNKIPSETAVRAAIEAKTINVDSTVTEGSTNAVSGGAVYTQLATKQGTLTFDTTPTASSSNPVTSGGVKTALDAKQNTLTFDTTPTASSSNPVTSGGVKAALDTKQNTLTYETTPIVGSVNPVTSTGIRNAIDAAAAGNLGQMQAEYDTFTNNISARVSSLSNGMVACSNIAAETTAGDTRILLYTGTTNANYTNGHWYYNSAASNAAPSWTDGGAVGSAPTIDNTLTTAGAAADSKSVGDAIENIVTISDTQPGSNSGNKVWIRETTDEEVQIPTYQEHISKANKADITTNNESDNGSGTITASKAYAIGDHFYINNTNTSSENYGVSVLYKATAAIASGSAIVVGTNCEASKVADEITSLSNDIDTVKADLDAVNDLVDYSPIITVSGSTPGTWKNGLKTLDGQALEANVKYMMTIELDAAQASMGYLYMLNSDDTTYSTKNLGAGQTSYSFEITSVTARTIKAVVGFSASGVGVTFQFYKKNRTTRLDTIESYLSSTQSKVVSILTQNYTISATSTDGIYVTRYSGQEGNTASDDASCATGYVEVLPKTVVKISGVYLSGNRTVATYDRDKHYIECLTSESLSATSLVVETGSNVRYIRATGRTGVTPTFEYLSVTSAQEVSEYNAVNGYRALYAESAKTPVVSIIDDDTWETQYVADLKSLCDTLGIKITFACLTSRFDVDANLASTLLGYEREGHAIITHGYTQGTFYDLSTRDMALAEADLVHGIQDLHAKGFSDYKAMWATPFGRYDDDLKKLAIKWGFESLVRYDYQEKVENPYEGNPKQRYQIYRYALVDGNGTIAINTAKTLIDKAVACNGWFLFGVHSASQYCRSEDFRTAMTEIITYARNSGCEIRTATEELRRRMPIYLNYEKY